MNLKENKTDIPEENQSNPSLREQSLDWFFRKNEIEKIDLKSKYFPKTHIEHSSLWGYHFTFGQIEEMYKNENSK